jgi:hypothetical protein
MRRGCCFLTHQSSGHASQQTVRTSTRQLRLERHGLGGEPSEPHWGSGPLGGPKLRPYIASASRNHKPRRSARRSLIGLRRAPFLAAGLLKTLGKHRQSLQTPSRHRRNPDRDGVHWHRLLDRIHGRAWGRFRPHHQKASDVLVLLGRILGKHGAFGVPIGLGCGPGFLAS